MVKQTFNPGFLDGHTVSLPSINSKESFLTNNHIIKLNHFSVLFSPDRKMAICTAVNIDGENQVEITRKSDNWKFYGHPLSESVQTGPSFYKQTNKEFHKGHIVRRLDPCWGTDEEAAIAEEDTFYYINACPQHRKFNPAIWLELERSVLEKGAMAFDKKLTVFSGPVLHKDDLPYINLVDDDYLFIPFMFWKIVVWKKDNGKAFAIGFVQSQKELIYPHLNTSYKAERVKSDFDKYIENLKFKNDAVYQTSIGNIEKITGLSFGFRNVVVPEVGVEWKEIKANYETKPGTKFKNDNIDSFTLDGIVFE